MVFIIMGSHNEKNVKEKNKISVRLGLGLDLDLDENYKLFYYLVYLLFMRLTVFFCIIYGSHYTILTNFYLYLQYF